jgi:hypothetical protein
MSNAFRLLPAALAAVLMLSLVPAPAGAAPRSVGHVKTTQARFGSRGFGRRTPAYRPRYRSPYRPGYRRSPFRGVFRGVLHALGIAFLVNALFGWGSGGSPLGLLLLAALVLWLFARPRRRRVHW